MEYSNTYRDADGTEVEIKIKTKSSTLEERRRTLSFMAQSSHKFYLEMAKKLVDLGSQPG